MSDRQFAFEKHTLEPGWAELRVIVPRPLQDTPDYVLSGNLALFKWVKFVLATAAGVAHEHGEHGLEMLVVEFWNRLQPAIARETELDS